MLSGVPGAAIGAALTFVPMVGTPITNAVAATIVKANLRMLTSWELFCLGYNFTPHRVMRQHSAVRLAAFALAQKEQEPSLIPASVPVS